MAQTVLNTRQAAQALGLRPSTLETWRVRGAGPVFLKLGKAVRYREEDLKTFLGACSRKNTSAGNE